MQLGPRIANLLTWAETHSPRTKELHRYIREVHDAIEEDSGRYKALCAAADKLQQDRDGLARIAFKLVSRERMTDDEYRLYASARINQGVAELIQKGAGGREEVLALAERAFEEIGFLGASPALIVEVRARFLETLTIDDNVSDS